MSIKPVEQYGCMVTIMLNDIQTKKKSKYLNFYSFAAGLIPVSCFHQSLFTCIYVLTMPHALTFMSLRSCF